MKYLIDSANAADIKKVLEYFPCEGVTTNPTIISREKGDLKNILKSIRNVIGDDMQMHAQVMADDCEGMISDAKALARFSGGNVYIKLPANPEGLKACRELKKEGIGVTMTAVFSPQQALLAARAGADFVAPYVNKYDDVGDGVRLVEQIAQIYAQFGLETKILSASFRNVEQVTSVALAGSDFITLPPAFFDKLIWHPMTDLAVKGFEKDWYTVYEKSPEGLLE